MYFLAVHDFFIFAQGFLIKRKTYWVYQLKFSGIYLNWMAKTIRLSRFPSSVTIEIVKEFLEKRTGEGTVCAVKVLPSTITSSKSDALVQFISSSQVDFIISLVKKRRLRYGRFDLKVCSMDNDIVPKPKNVLHSLDDTILHFGCQITKDRFSVLWTVKIGFVDFGSGLRKLQFYFSHGSIRYKLQLSYENIWQIVLHRPHGQTAKYLLIQLVGAPRIYDGGSSQTGYDSDGPITPDDQCVRTTDFTPLCSIGQSSALCLEIPSNGILPNFKDNFAFYKKNKGKFTLEPGGTFCPNLDLVPIIHPPQGVDLPFEILFQINLLVQNGCLPGPALDVDFYQLVDPRRFDSVFIECALEKLYNLRECCYEPSTWLRDQYKTYRTSKRPPRSSAISLDAGLVYVRRVQITPCKVYFYGPEVNLSNRVLRNYPEDINNFLRVSFVDEELGKIFSTDLLPRTSAANEGERTAIYRRILSVLKNGIKIGEKKFEFLAFSSSQLRESSVWMFASREGLTAADIREWMGNFRGIRNVAKYAARLGQSFGSSVETLTVSKHEIEKIPDVEVERDGINYVFSDGIGKISKSFAKKVALKCGFKGPVPSAFQIRYGGYKGVVAVDPTSSAKLSLRKSMCKYESANTKLDVLAHSKFQPCFLNRQIITLLSTLGLADGVFEKKQREAVEQLDAILTDPLRAQQALEIMPFGEITNVLKELLKCGYKPNVEPFLSMMLQSFRSSKLLEIRTKSRIFIQNGRSMMGCLDETRTLEYGQVFVQFSGKRHWQFFNDSSVFGGHGSGGHSIVKGKVVVAKNPCLHPGDVRVLEAVDVPALRHMVNCIVFPQKGERPHPNECSGSDLDGDVYFVCWDTELIPPKQVQPMDYTPAPSKELDHDVTIEEIQEYFANYMVNDSLGIIANAHTVFADIGPSKAMSDNCIELAKLFSIAVDFPKTGVPAVIPRHLYVKEYPDFMEKPDKPTYESSNVIGKLFRKVKDIAPDSNSIESFTLDMARQLYDPDMEVDGFEHYTDDAFYYKSKYDKKLKNLLYYYGIKTEAEFLSGNIMKMSKSFSKKQNAESITMAARSLKEEVRTWFNEKTTGSEFKDDVYAKASAWYHVTYHRSYFGAYNEGMNCDYYLSFPWCVYDKLICIKKDKTARRRRRAPMSSLEHQFSHGFRLH